MPIRIAARALRAVSCAWSPPAHAAPTILLHIEDCAPHQNPPPSHPGAASPPRGSAPSPKNPPDSPCSRPTKLLRYQINAA